jgi:small subunit ribosomal protein S10e
VAALVAMILSALQFKCFTAAEGVLWAPKDFGLPDHPEMPGIPNLYVIKAMQSFESKEFVTARYAWRNHYWFLTDAGIEYLRDFLNIPDTVAPATHIRQSNRCASFAALPQE